MSWFDTFARGPFYFVARSSFFPFRISLSPFFFSNLPSLFATPSEATCLVSKISRNLPFFDHFAFESVFFLLRDLSFLRSTANPPLTHLWFQEALLGISARLAGYTALSGSQRLFLTRHFWSDLRLLPHAPGLCSFSVLAAILC